MLLISQLSRLKQCGWSTLLKNTTYWYSRSFKRRSLYQESDILLTTSYSRHLTHDILLTTSYSRHLTHDILLTTYYSRHLTHDILLTTSYSRHLTHITNVVRYARCHLVKNYFWICIFKSLRIFDNWGLMSTWRRLTLISPTSPRQYVFFIKISIEETYIYLFEENFEEILLLPILFILCNALCISLLIAIAC